MGWSGTHVTRNSGSSGGAALLGEEGAEEEGAGGGGRVEACEMKGRVAPVCRISSAEKERRDVVSVKES
jgi:hypothetical protein